MSLSKSKIRKQPEEYNYPSSFSSSKRIRISPNIWNSTDLVVEIFSYLSSSLFLLNTLTKVNKQWNQLIKKEKMWSHRNLYYIFQNTNHLNTFFSNYSFLRDLTIYLPDSEYFDKTNTDIMPLFNNLKNLSLVFKFKFLSESKNETLSIIKKITKVLPKSLKSFSYKELDSFQNFSTTNFPKTTNFNFEVLCNYLPNLNKISFSNILILSSKKKNSQEMLSSYSKIESLEINECHYENLFTFLNCFINLKSLTVDENMKKRTNLDLLSTFTQLEVLDLGGSALSLLPIFNSSNNIPSSLTIRNFYKDPFTLENIDSALHQVISLTIDNICFISFNMFSKFNNLKKLKLINCKIDYTNEKENLISHLLSIKCYETLEELTIKNCYQSVWEQNRRSKLESRFYLDFIWLKSFSCLKKLSVENINLSLFSLKLEQLEIIYPCILLEKDTEDNPKHSLIGTKRLL